MAAIKARGYPVAFEARAEDLDRRAFTCGKVCNPAQVVNVNFYLDNAVFLRSRVQRVLDITFADHAKVANHIDRGGPEHVIVGIG